MSNVFKLILSMSLSGSVLILILLALRPVLKERFAKSWQYYIWLVVLFRLILPFSFTCGPINDLFREDFFKPAPSLETPVFSGPVVSPIDMSIHQKSSGPSPTPPITPSQSPAKGWDMWETAGGLWLAGAFSALLWKVLSYAHFKRKLYSQASKVTDEERLLLFSQTAAKLRVKKNLPLFTSEWISSPLVIGLINPAVFLPRSALTMDRESLGYVYWHELMHFKRFDLPYKWFVELAACLHWFNPLCMVLRNQIGRLCELSCDEAVAKDLNLDGKRAYGATLLQAVSKDTALRRGVLATTLCEDKKSLKERLSVILQAGRKSKRTAVAFILVAVCLCAAAVSLGVFSSGDKAPTQLHMESLPYENPKPIYASSSAEEAPVRALVEAFGKRLQMVSLLAPDELVKESIEKNYSRYVTPELFSKWEKDPKMAPGRLVSSPWPDRIEIFAVTRESEDSFIVHGQIVEITSAEMESGGAAATRPIALYIIHRDKGWLIDDITIGDYTKPPIGYQNDQYGFTFRLPESWQGYSVVETKWNGTAIGGSEAIESGPLLSIRHPGWTEEKPRQDIPVMVFTIEQWNALQKEEFAVSAAPIGPKKLGADARYVFALPPRYNFAFLPGYEEVEEILSANPLNPF